MEAILIEEIDSNQETNSAYMPILWHPEECNLQLWKSLFTNQYGNRITWII